MTPPLAFNNKQCNLPGFTGCVLNSDAYLGTFKDSDNCYLHFFENLN